MSGTIDPAKPARRRATWAQVATPPRELAPFARTRRRDGESSPPPVPQLVASGGVGAGGIATARRRAPTLLQHCGASPGRDLAARPALVTDSLGDGERAVRTCSAPYPLRCPERSFPRPLGGGDSPAAHFRRRKPVTGRNGHPGHGRTGQNARSVALVSRRCGRPPDRRPLPGSRRLRERQARDTGGDDPRSSGGEGRCRPPGQPETAIPVLGCPGAETIRGRRATASALRQ